jgi:ligand-binding SRPBCC domain-containing protein
MRTFDAEMWLPLPIEAVFAFFADAANLDAITPPWLRFQTVQAAVELKAGTIFDHRLKVHGVPIHWVSEITVWDPPLRFVDEQRRGPYKHWVHRHDFVAENGGTWVRDHVDYVPRGWVLEPLINRWLVAPDLRKIFAYRHGKIRELLAPGSDARADRVW